MYQDDEEAGIFWDNYQSPSTTFIPIEILIPEWVWEMGTIEAIMFSDRHKTTVIAPKKGMFVEFHGWHSWHLLSQMMIGSIIWLDDGLTWLVCEYAEPYDTFYPNERQDWQLYTWVEYRRPRFPLPRAD